MSSEGNTKKSRGQHSHHQAIIHAAGEIRLDPLPEFILLRLKTQPPKQGGNPNEERIVRNVTTDAEPV